MAKIILLCAQAPENTIISENNMPGRKNTGTGYCVWESESNSITQTFLKINSNGHSNRGTEAAVRVIAK